MVRVRVRLSQGLCPFVEPLVNERSRVQVPLGIIMRIKCYGCTPPCQGGSEGSIPSIRSQ